jgi:plasmid stabilization system protein ParE
VAGTYRLTPAARAAVASHLTWLEENNPPAAARFQGALENAIETLASGVVDGRPVRLQSGHPARRWYVRPLILYYQRHSDVVVVLHARHEARRPLEP